jgi:translation initiation factor 2-alpha kinase 4
MSVVKSGTLISPLWNALSSPLITYWLSGPIPEFGFRSGSLGVMVCAPRFMLPVTLAVPPTRYDGLIDHFRVPTTEPRAPIKAICLQIVLEQLAQLASAYTKTRIGALLSSSTAAYSASAAGHPATSRRSYGTLAPRRCDVYVVSTGSGPTSVTASAMSLGSAIGLSSPGGAKGSAATTTALSLTTSDLPTVVPDSQLEARMRVVARLWQAGISADLMYDDVTSGKTVEAHLENCLREGIL